MTVVRGKFVAMRAYIEKLQRYKISSMSQVLEKQGQDKPQRTSQQETIKTSMEINKMESKATMRRIYQRKSWLF